MFYVFLSCCHYQHYRICYSKAGYCIISSPEQKW